MDLLYSLMGGRRPRWAQVFRYLFLNFLELLEGVSRFRKVTAPPLATFVNLFALFSFASLRLGSLYRMAPGDLPITLRSISSRLPMSTSSVTFSLCAHPPIAPKQSPPYSSQVFGLEHDCISEYIWLSTFSCPLGKKRKIFRISTLSCIFVT